MTITIYHNKRCSKSRQTLNLLLEHNIKPIEINYLESPPNYDTLKSLLRMLSISARELLRPSETEYNNLSLDNRELDEDFLIHAMIEHPILIQRPIVIANGQARIGRPPENILEIL